MKCEHVGMNLAILCQKHAMTFSHGFPNHEDAQISKSEEIFGLDFLTGKELKFENDEEIIALCKNNESLDAWLDAVSKKTFHFSGYKKVMYKSILVGCNCTHLKEYFSDMINSFYCGDLKSLQL